MLIWKYKQQEEIEKMDILQVITQELGVEKWQVEAAVKLIDEGNTIPFISRYRKEATGALNDEQLRNLDERLRYLRNLEDKKQQGIATIRDQGKMTDTLLKQIEEAQTQVVVDDLYRPYRPKRRTRAMIAKEKGLEKLAAAVMAQNLRHPVEEEAAAYVSEEKGVTAKLYKPDDASEEAYLSAVKKAADDGAGMIVMAGSGFAQAVYSAQSAYPDTDFLLIDGVPHDESINIQSFYLF